MSEKIRPDTFRESMDRYYGDVKPDPFLARRIIASEKGENRMHRTISTRVVTIVAVLVLIAAAACAATELIRRQAWGGGGVYEFTMEAEETDPIPEYRSEDAAGLIMDVPDDAYAVAYVRSRDGSYDITVRDHPKMKVFEDPEAFMAAAGEIGYLTLPVELPEELEYFYGEIIYGLKQEGNKESFLWEGFREENEHAHLVEEKQKNNVSFRRYELDEDAVIVTGYHISMGVNGKQLVVNAEVTCSDDIFLLPDDSATREVTVQGMESALLAVQEDPAWPTPNDLYMRRTLDTKALFGTDVEAEEVIYASYEGTDAELLVKMFGGK